MEKNRRTLRLPPELADWADTVAGELGLTANAFMVQAVRNWADYHGKRLGLNGPKLAGAVKASKPAPGRKADREPDDDAPLPGLGPVPEPVRRDVPKVGANQPCPCGSGRKYKRCHGQA